MCLVKNFFKLKSFKKATSVHEDIQELRMFPAFKIQIRAFSKQFYKMFPFLPEKVASETEEEEDEEDDEETQEEHVDDEILTTNLEIKECFDLFDKNKIGTFDAKYLEKALRCLGIILPPFELEKATELLDENGMVFFEKFQPYAFEKMMEADPIDNLRTAFQVFDPDNEGVLPSERLKKWLMTLGDPLTERDARDLVKLGDPTGRGFVSYEEIIMTLATK